MKGQDFKCFLGAHHYEVLEEANVTRVGSDLVIGKTIVCRCTNCGKIKCFDVKLTTLDY